MRQSAVPVALAAILIASTPLAAREATDAGWLRVIGLPSGQPITLTIRNDQPADRYFLLADDVSMTVLNLSDPALPRRVTKTLRQIASEHPEYFGEAARRGTFVIDEVRMSPAGVFVGNEKVADLRGIVEMVPRLEVVEITRVRKGRGLWGHLGPVGGYLVGAMTGGVTAGLACQAAGGSDRCDSGAFMVGMVAGGVVGGLYGFGAQRAETAELIYRASDGMAR